MRVGEWGTRDEVVCLSDGMTCAHKKPKTQNSFMQHNNCHRHPNQISLLGIEIFQDFGGLGTGKGLTRYINV